MFPAQSQDSMAIRPLLSHQLSPHSAEPNHRCGASSLGRSFTWRLQIARCRWKIRKPSCGVHDFSPVRAYPCTDPNRRPLIKGTGRPRGLRATPQVMLRCSASSPPGHTGLSLLTKTPAPPRGMSLIRPSVLWQCSSDALMRLAVSRSLQDATRPE